MPICLNVYQVFSMPIDHRLELPQWMVEGLNTGRNPHLDVEVGALLILLISTVPISGAEDLPGGVP